VLEWELELGRMMRMTMGPLASLDSSKHLLGSLVARHLHLQKRMSSEMGEHTHGLVQCQGS